MFNYALIHRETMPYNGLHFLILPFLLTIHQAIMPTFHSEWLILLAFAFLAYAQAAAIGKNDAICVQKPWAEHLIFTVGFLFFGAYILLQSIILQNHYPLLGGGLPAFIKDGQITTFCFMALALAVHRLAQYYRLEYARHRQLAFFLTILRVLVILGFAQSLILWLQFLTWERSFLKGILNIIHGFAYILQALHFSWGDALLQVDLNDIRLISLASRGDQTFRPFANLNQPNHASSLMAWAVLAYLMQHTLWWVFNAPLESKASVRKNHLKYGLGAFILITAWVLPASRTALFQILALILMLGVIACIFGARLWLDQKIVYFKYKRHIRLLEDEQQRNYTYHLLKVLKLCVIYALIFLVSAWLIDVCADLLKNNASTLWQRLFTPYDNQSYAQLDMRGLLHKQGIAMFEGAPWWGIGANGFAWHQYQLIDRFSFSEFANSSHQVVIDTFAKFGIFGFVIIFLTFVSYTLYQLYIIYRLFTQFRSQSIHDLFERLALKKQMIADGLYTANDYEDHHFNAYLEKIHTQAYIFKARNTFRYLLAGVFSLGFLNLFLIHALVEYPQNYLFFWLFLVFVLSALQLSSLQLRADDFHRDFEDDYISGRFDSIKQAYSDAKIDPKPAPSFIKKLKINDVAYMCAKKIFLLSSMATAILMLAFGVWRDFQTLKNQQMPDVFFKGYAFYQKASGELYQQSIQPLLQNAKLTLADEKMCRKAQNITRQGLYLFTSHDILKRDIYLSICQNQINEALNAYQRMQLYFYAPKTWQQDILKDLQAFGDPRFMVFAEKVKNLPLKKI